MDKLLTSFYRVTAEGTKGIEGLRKAFIETYGYDPADDHDCHDGPEDSCECYKIEK